MSSVSQQCFVFFPICIHLCFLPQALLLVTQALLEAIQVHAGPVLIEDTIDKDHRKNGISIDSSFFIDHSLANVLLWISFMENGSCLKGTSFFFFKSVLKQQSGSFPAALDDPFTMHL